MKKTGILNSDISSVLSYMGHTDTLAVGDCGLPVPEKTMRIDLALKRGVPRFMEVLQTVAEDMKIEKIILAQEIKEQNPDICEAVLALIETFEKPCEVEYISHEELKGRLASCKAVIRTGETTPYANVILQSACLF